MSQVYDSSKPISGATTFGELYQILRDHFAACVSNFSGIATPSNPATGQPWYDTTNTRLYVYDGSVWRDVDYHTSIHSEVITARGSASSLNTRLSAALNLDGTLSGTSPAGAWFTSGTTPWRYYSTCQFEENGDKTSVYTVGRAIYIAGSASPGFSFVTAAVIAGTSTLVTLKDAYCDASMTTPQFGQQNFNYHYKQPWTRVLFSNSATSRDYAATDFGIVADGAGGVTSVKVVKDTVNNSNFKKFGSF